MRWPGSLDQPHTLHFLPDAARGLATLVLDERADGGVWHLPAALPATGTVGSAASAGVESHAAAANKVKLLAKLLALSFMAATVPAPVMARCRWLAKNCR